MAKLMSVVKANKNHVNHISRATLRLTGAQYTTLAGRPGLKPPTHLLIANFKKERATPTPTPTGKTTINIRAPYPTSLMYMSTTSTSTCDQNQLQNNNDNSPTLCSLGDPCLAIFFNVMPDTPATHTYLNKLLPLAWSNNPITTLKLIWNLRDWSNGKSDDEAFYTAVFWLHQNHAKTLNRNVPSIAARPFGSLYDLTEILYRFAGGRSSSIREETLAMAKKALDRYRDETLCMAKKVLDRYECDPDYQLLHDRVTDLFVECLKSDIEKLKKLKLKYSDIFDDDDDDDDEQVYDDEEELQITEAADCCLSKHPDDAHIARATLMCESIARKVFPRELYHEYKEDYADRVLDRLKKEFLVPLRKVYNRQFRGHRLKACKVNRYLKEVKEGGKSNIVASALLPHEIINYVNDGDVGQAAELQWKAMVEDMLKQGKMHNCLAVCDVNPIMGKGIIDISVGLGVLVSELSEEPWKQKVINFSESPELLSIQGVDLKSKCAFVMRMDGGNLVNFEKVADLILEVAVNGNLKPEQMIKKLFVFSDDNISFQFVNWETKYETIRSKFKDKGYGNAVPQIVFCDLVDYWSKTPELPITRSGAVLLTGFKENLIKSFLDNNGEIDPPRIVEAAISDKEYQTLAIVD